MIVWPAVSTHKAIVHYMDCGLNVKDEDRVGQEKGTGS